MIDLSLLQDFIAESEEHLEEMEAGLLKLESEPDNRESLNDVFRTAHSIKGSAEYIGAEKTALLSHKLENLLEAVRQGKQILNDKIINTLMDARD
ncbi:MAG: Hpt domain-containing protein, partial [Desulfosarcina sp.]|nr:Hpt domain-containing protein [Desulfobacterales bacterium]